MQRTRLFQRDALAQPALPAEPLQVPLRRPSQWLSPDMRAALERRRLAEETHKVEIQVLVPDDPSAHVDVALQLEVLVADPEVRRELAEKAEAARVKAEEMAREAEERAARAAEARKEAEKMAKTRRTAGLVFRAPKPEHEPDEPCFRIGGVFVRTGAAVPSATASPSPPLSPPKRMASCGDAIAPSPARSPSRYVGTATAPGVGPADTEAAAEAEAADAGAATDTAGSQGGARFGAASARVREDAAAIEELIERWLDAGLAMDGEAWRHSAQQNAAGARPWWLEGGGGAQVGKAAGAVDVDEAAAAAMSRLTRLTNERAERLALALTRPTFASRWRFLRRWSHRWHPWHHLNLVGRRRFRLCLLATSCPGIPRSSVGEPTPA